MERFTAALDPNKSLQRSPADGRLGGNVTAGVDLDPWGRETSRGWNQGQFPRRYTSYERDGNQSDEAMHRRYNRRHMRFDQPDPYDGSYDLSDPQTFNRYSYTNNDPVNFTDPSGLKANCNGVETTDPATGQTTCIPARDFGVVTVTPGNGINEGLASLMFGRIAHDLRLRPISLMSDLRMIGGGPGIEPGTNTNAGQAIDEICFRGRIQIQGSNPRVEKSKKWAQGPANRLLLSRTG